LFRVSAGPLMEVCLNMRGPLSRSVLDISNRAAAPEF
jgi:hypothetical protein